MQAGDEAVFSPSLCPDCGGSWINGDSLTGFVARYTDADEVEGVFEELMHLEFTTSRRKCPDCEDRRLEKVFVGGTELDYCVGCKGLFFDKGELEQVFPVSRDTDNSDDEGFLKSLLSWLGGDK